MRFLFQAITCSVLAYCVPAQAMEFELRHVASTDNPAATRPVLILSGSVEGNEMRHLQDWFEKNPEIDTIVLKNSRGGDAPTGYRVGEYLREKGLNTLVAGYCLSSCSRMFLGGKKRSFSDELPLDRTFVGFHGNYANDGSLLYARVSTLKAWIIKYSDGKANPELVDQWVNLQNRRGFAYFHHQQASAALGSQRVLLCQGSEDQQRRRELCAKPDLGDALTNGIVTDWDIVKINYKPAKQEETQ